MLRSLGIHKISCIGYMWVIRKDAWCGRILVLLVTLMEEEVKKLSKNKSNNKNPNILVEEVMPKPP